MEYEKSYVFQPDEMRPTKRRRTEPQGLQASWKTRRQMHRTAWQTEQESIEVHPAFPCVFIHKADTARRNSTRSIRLQWLKFRLFWTVHLTRDHLVVSPQASWSRGQARRLQGLCVNCQDEEAGIPDRTSSYLYHQALAQI